jgi:hypothetical protein
VQVEELEGIAEVLQSMSKCCFTYSSSVESALALENELNALGIKAKVISQTQLILMRRKPWLML